MKKLIILLFFISVTHAEIPKACQLVDDTSETLMQLRQSGLSLDDVNLNPEALSEEEVRLLEAMIDDAKRVPVYQIALTRQKAINEFKQNWLEHCLFSQNEQTKDVRQ